MLTIPDFALLAEYLYLWEKMNIFQHKYSTIVIQWNQESHGTGR